ncbi:MAG: response regulator [Dehalococcoidia bacterium]|nr:response regulator [Dehalococcoidia bacterium]
MARVLIVDDDASTVRLISLLLRCESMDVIQTFDGKQALRVMQRVHPDVVVMDLQMPRMDGWAFFEEARRQGYDGPVMVCTALDARAAQRELGADAYLQKPFDPDKLVESVRELLGRAA